MTDFKKQSNMSDSSNTTENDQMDFLIKINQVRSKIPHQRTRYFAKLALMVLYEKKGLNPDHISIPNEEEAPDDNPGDEIFNKCMVHALDENYSEALKFAGAAIENYPDNPEAWFVSGFAKSVFGEAEAAIADYKNAIRIKSEESVYYFELGALYETLGELELAIEEYVKAIKLSPETTVYRYAVGSIFFQVKRYEDALTAFESCVKEEASLEFFQEGLATLYNDIAVSDWAKDPSGLFRCITEASAKKALDYLTRAEKLNFNNNSLKERISENLSVTKWVLEKHWGRSFLQTIKGAIIAIVAAFIIGIPLESAAGTSVSVIVMIAVMAFWIAMGFKPGWKINEAVLTDLQIENRVRQEMGI